ncbi:MAG: hypothetical protein J5546_10770 [Lachnospiraceae bacterium]|nr:hypothetical protein [Lachnospiraceae bacterium]
MQDNVLEEKQAEVKQSEVTKNEEKSEQKLGIGTILKTVYMCVTVLAALLTFSAATYAWFSTNSVVNTTRASGKTNTDQVDLQISANGEGNFQAAKEAPLVQINATKLLMPISTADLRTFVVNTNTVDDMAVSFNKVTSEKYYYHGRVYLKAASTGHAEGAKLALYLDGTEGIGANVYTTAKGTIARAARLGMTFDGANAKIMRLTEESNPSGQQVLNTKVGGVAVQAGQVINGSADPMQIVADPSAPISTFAIGADGVTGMESKTPLLMMELNHIYAVDIYFYLEGCDPDCSDVAKLDSIDMHLAFYGVLVEGAN